MTDETRARWVRWLNRLRWVAIRTFILGIAIPIVTIGLIGTTLRPNNWQTLAFLFPAALMLLLSPVVLICAIVARDVLSGKQRRQFSLRELLGWMTGIAIALGILAYLLRQ